jgi:dynein heavy chain, axonemal
LGETATEGDMELAGTEQTEIFESVPEPIQESAAEKTELGLSDTVEAESETGVTVTREETLDATITDTAASIDLDEGADDSDQLSKIEITNDKSAIKPVKERTKMIYRWVVQQLDQQEKKQDWIAAVFIVKSDIVQKSDFDTMYQCAVMPTGPIAKLNQIIIKAYIPHIRNVAGLPSNADEIEDTDAAGLSRNEVLMNARKLAGQLSGAVSLLKGDVLLQMPEVNSDVEIFHLMRDEASLGRLRDALEHWTATVRDLLDETRARVPSAKGCLAEIEFWRDRFTALDRVYEQLHGSERFGKIVKLMQACLEGEYSQFDHWFQELMKLHTEAKDNVKFLSTLERHFKMLQDAPIAAVLESLNGLMNGLRMVWVLSRHYNTDQRMSQLMSRIAQELADRVIHEVNIKELFNEASMMHIIAKFAEARHLMESFKTTYMKTREKIEQSGRDLRWEFDKKILFGQTDYISQRLQDLEAIAETIDTFRVFFGPALRKVIGDAQSIERMLEDVNGMLRPIFEMSFPVFNREYAMQWEELHNNFLKSVEHIDIEAKHLITRSFSELRSTESALQLLNLFSSIKCRDAITSAMKDKLAEILVNFSKDIVDSEKIFKECSELFDRLLSGDNTADPPISKNQPPVTGAIMWSRGLFQRVKKTMLQFQSYEHMKKSDQGQAATKQYIDFGRRIRDFENTHYNAWKVKTEQEIIDLLKSPILRITNEDKMDVNFPAQLSQIIREAKGLDKLGFLIPETALHVALQEEKYIKLVQDIKRMVRNYQSTIENIDPSLKEICTQNVQNLKSGLSLGFTALNWNSLGIKDFIEKSQTRLQIFQSVLRAIEKNAGTIHDILREISDEHLMPSEEDLLEGMSEGIDLHDLVSRIEKHRVEVVDRLVQKHSQITPLINKVCKTFESSILPKVF